MKLLIESYIPSTSFSVEIVISLSPVSAVAVIVRPLIEYVLVLLVNIAPLSSISESSAYTLFALVPVVSCTPNVDKAALYFCDIILASEVASVTPNVVNAALYVSDVLSALLAVTIL